MYDSWRLKKKERWRRFDRHGEGCLYLCAFLRFFVACEQASSKHFIPKSLLF